MTTGTIHVVHPRVKHQTFCHRATDDVAAMSLDAWTARGNYDNICARCVDQIQLTGLRTMENTDDY